ncbi:ATP-binding protein [Novosphingobium mathurense]|uniref:Serine/threonine-protein kinase RsbW n=1 Tax=Novosphingobium mathurense TaxID=428990 RepID=A0A1U6GS04_9SPHN|nr:ATP-binding protein [Novosphingobium mathurense]SLJ86315.1 serine/threonine-protein kinase RsbW [Novosphingobium mathurense]
MPLSADRPGVIAIAANLAEVRRLAAFLKEFCVRAGVVEAASLDLELALVEAANNVVEHGYTNTGQGEMTLEVSLAGDELRLVLTDGGSPVPEGYFSQCRVVDLDATHGRGCNIIQACVDEIDYVSAGGFNRLTLVKRLQS